MIGINVLVMGAKQLLPSARQSSCTSVVVGQNVPWYAQCEGFEASATFPDLSQRDFSYFRYQKMF
jgi:hypothetical protein